MTPQKALKKPPQRVATKKESNIMLATFVLGFALTTHFFDIDKDE